MSEDRRCFLVERLLYWNEWAKIPNRDRGGIGGGIGSSRNETPHSLKRPFGGLSCATLSVATLFMLAMLSSSFGTAGELSSAGTETGTAACYSRWLRGHHTSSGQRYNPNALTAAHATIPFGTLVKLTNIENGRSVVVAVNDRLSAHSGDGIILDISQRACMALKFPRSEKARVTLEVIGSKS